MPKNTSESPYAAHYNQQWKYPGGILVTAHNYDNALLAFEVIERKKHLGTVIPKSIAETNYMLNHLDKQESLDGFHCNDDAGTIIHYQKKR